MFFLRLILKNNYFATKCYAPTIKRAVSHLKIPFLIIHGNEDTSILIEEAENLRKWQPKSELQIINGANHVFNTAHPWKENNLPKALEEVVSIAVAFIKLKTR